MEVRDTCVEILDGMRRHQPAYVVMVHEEGKAVLVPGLINGGNQALKSRMRRETVPAGVDG